GDGSKCALLIRHAFLNTLNEQVSDTLRIIYGRIARSQLRTAPQAWAETRLFCLLRRIVKSAINFLGRLDRANGTAINARRRDADEKEAVKTPVAGQECFVEGFAVRFHPTNIRCSAS